MNHLPIWQTLFEALNFVKNNVGFFLKSIIFPLILLIFTSTPLLLPQQTPISPMLQGTSTFFQTLLIVWMGNICYRITITGSAGKLWWSMRETWSLIWMILLSMMVAIAAAIPAGLVYFAVSILQIGSPFTAIIAAGATYSVLIYYLIARLSLLLPSIAVGTDLRFKDIWAKTTENGWRLMILFSLPPMITLIICLLLFFVLEMFMMPIDSMFTGFIGMSIFQVSAALLFCVNATIIAFAYKKLVM
jgi:hypothetical protein